MFSDVLRDLFHSGLGVIRVAAERFFGVPRVTALPTAGIDYRGTLTRLEGGAGVADRLVFARKNTSDAYEWADIPTLVSAARGVIPVFNVRDYNAKGDAVADDTTAVMAAVTAAIAAGGGIVYFPAGTYVVANGGSATGIQVTGSGVRLIGAGAEVTTITIANGTNDHVINVVGNDCEIAYLTIDGNRANNSGGVHGIRMEGERHHVHDCIIEQTVHYGIGLGQAVGTALRHSLFENLLIRNTGADGIDLKNRLSTNVGNRFSNIIIENFDLAANTAQAGLDIRGHATVDGLWVYSDPVPGGGSGLRFRDDATTTGSATNCHLSGLNSNTGDVDITTGVSIGAQAADVAVSNVYAVGWERAFAISGQRACLTNCRSIDATNIGFFTRDGVNQTLANCVAEGAVTGFNLEGDEAQLLGCRAVDCTTSGIRVAGDRNEIASCRLDAAAGNGVLLVAGADDTRIHDSDFTQHAGTDINNGGTRTLAWHNAGAAPVGSSETLTIATDAVTITDGFKTLVLVDTEAAAAADNLTAISGGEVGQYVTLRTVNSARDVTVVDGGTLRLAGNMVLDDIADTITLQCVAAGTWHEVGRANNA